MDLQSSLQHCVGKTSVDFLPEPYRGKVRDVYRLDEKRLAIVSSDRISAFDHILRQLIPYKGQILNTLATFFFERVDDIVETHIIDVPHPNITIAKSCDSLPVEVVVRGYLTGHAWRTYKSGSRVLCGVPLPDGMIENQAFKTPILTPATKATEGHDEDISEDEILSRGLVPEIVWNQVRDHAFKLFERGTEIAKEKGLILVDTKYEFGTQNDRVILIDEVHTPDSSRYFYSQGYEENLNHGKPQRQLSKEFIREWLMAHDFQGLDGQNMPDLSDSFRIEIYQRYEELFNSLTGTVFVPTETRNFNETLGTILRKFV
ncbi:MAG TPA: phosphoribosylaminoimidazolesuccinocarboxamide synthase [Bacteroidetes bacterium]|nr:phosphoribosylaminoimidazolesuccinocarboxamide synthase [Bacteroidota bacterium]